MSKVLCQIHTAWTANPLPLVGISDQRKKFRAHPKAVHSLPGGPLRSEKSYYDTSGKPSIPCSIRMLSNILSSSDLSFN